MEDPRFRISFNGNKRVSVVFAANPAKWQISCELIQELSILSRQTAKIRKTAKKSRRSEVCGSRGLMEARTNGVKPVPQRPNVELKNSETVLNRLSSNLDRLEVKCFYAGHDLSTSN